MNEIEIIVSGNSEVIADLEKFCAEQGVKTNRNKVLMANEESSLLSCVTAVIVATIYSAPKIIAAFTQHRKNLRFSHYEEAKGWTEIDGAASPEEITLILKTQNELHLEETKKKPDSN